MPAEWKAVQNIPPLEPDQLQLWRIELEDVNSDLLAVCTRILSSTEQNTASRRRAGQVREQFAIGRACLRLLLGHSLGLGPRNVPIVTGTHGKPYTPAIDGHGIEYNLAHSKNTILIALRRHGAVGVDIEHIDPSSDGMEIAARWFTAKEVAGLASLADPDARSQLFFRYWTRKEAVAKADGRGLIVSLDAFDVALDPATPEPASVHMPCAETERLYLLRDLDLGPEFAGALALESADAIVTRYTFPLQLLMEAL